MPVFASIDLGTNTVRLLVAESNGEGFTPIYSNQAITRLGEGLSKGGVLIEKAMERTINTILKFKKEASAYNPSHIWVAATSAVREANNRSEFIEKVKNATGIELEVIPWEEEARRTILGVFSGNLPIPLLCKEGSKGRSIIFDIGGGSTEFVLATVTQTLRFELQKSVGTDLGVVHLSEKYIKKDPVDEDELRILENVIDDKIKNVRDRINSSLVPRPSSLLIGTAGTITTLAALDLNLYPYDPAKVNGYILGLKNVKDILKRLKVMTLNERRNIPALEKGREDLIIPGAVIVIKTMEVFGFDSMVVSDYGLREGIILAKMSGLI